MRRVAVVTVIVCCAAVATAVGNAMTTGGGTTPAAVLKQEAVDLNTRSWKPFYALMGPKFHAQCKYSTFVARQEYVLTKIKTASIKNISARLVGSKAYLTYETVAPPLKPFVTRNDLFVKISGRWYDELDAVTFC